MAPVSPAPATSSATAEERGKRLKTEPSDRFQDVVELKESDFSMYDDDSEPYFVVTRNFTYMNKAMKKQNEVVARYREQSRNVDAFDAIPVPLNSGLLGAVHPRPITDYNRPLLIHLCNCALEHYNAENQNANFEFAHLVKFTRALVNGLLYFITFEAKDDADPPNSSTRTFQAEVWKKRDENEKPETRLCRMKPT